MISFENHAFRGLDAALKQLLELQHSMVDEIAQLIALLPRGLDVADPQAVADGKSIDKKINESELATDRLVADIINKFTPMGEELRFVLASVKTAGTLEAAADKIKNCIKRLAKVNHPLDETVKLQLATAIKAVDAMLPKALGMLTNYDEAVRVELLKHGAEVQTSYKQILIRLHTQPSAAASDATHVLLVAKNLDQTADMAIEIMKISHYVNFGTKYEKLKESN